VVRSVRRQTSVVEFAERRIVDPRHVEESVDVGITATRFIRARETRVVTVQTAPKVGRIDETSYSRNACQRNIRFRYIRGPPSGSADNRNRRLPSDAPNLRDCRCNSFRSSSVGTSDVVDRPIDAPLRVKTSGYDQIVRERIVSTSRPCVFFSRFQVGSIPGYTRVPKSIRVWSKPYVDPHERTELQVDSIG
jgi:hypothetical protein